MDVLRNHKPVIPFFHESSHFWRIPQALVLELRPSSIFVGSSPHRTLLFQRPNCSPWPISAHTKLCSSGGPIGPSPLQLPPRAVADLLSLWAREPTPISALSRARLAPVPFDSRHGPWPGDDQSIFVITGMARPDSLPRFSLRGHAIPEPKILGRHKNPIEALLPHATPTLFQRHPWRRATICRRPCGLRWSYADRRRRRYMYRYCYY